jgi:hypothetical protein
MSQVPVSRGMRICEKVIIEEGTHNYSLINCFSRLVVSSSPSEPWDFVVHALLTDGFGALNLEVCITQLGEDEELYRYETPIRLRDRLHESRMSLRVRDFVFPAAGRYQVALFIDGHLVDQTVLSILVQGHGQ